MLVNNQEEYLRILGALTKAPFLALDTETTGLRQYHGNSVFSVILATEKDVYYFPVGPAKGIYRPLDIKPLAKFLEALNYQVLFLQNAKFDLRFLLQLGITLKPTVTIHDTAVGARLLKSDLRSISLDAIAAEFLNSRKDDKVLAYIDEHSLWEWADIPGIARRSKNLFFNEVPLEIIQPYAEMDARLTYDLGIFQIKEIGMIDANAPEGWPHLAQVLHNERALTQTCLKMEHDGVRVDVAYCERAIEFERGRILAAVDAFQEATGQEYVASAKAFEKAFEGEIEADHPTTDKGALRFDKGTLKGMVHAGAYHALEAKDAKSRLNFYAGFLYQADPKNFVHTNFKQAGTTTGRFSSAEPNLQNLKRPDDLSKDPFTPRGAIIPTSPEFCLVMLDYQAMEYRVMLDYAGEKEMIARVIAGADVHQATADLVGITRQQAKTLNFALLYGAGRNKIAAMLDLEPGEAGNLIRTFFQALPGVERLIQNVRNNAKNRGYIFNWYGRRLHYTDRNLTYAAPNHLIQGSCGDVVKVAMNKTHQLLRNLKSKLSLTIHDELVLNVHRSELGVEDEVQAIMEKAYPHRYLPLKTEVSHSWKSLAEKVKGPPRAFES